MEIWENNPSHAESSGVFGPGVTRWRRQAPLEMVCGGGPFRSTSVISLGEVALLKMQGRMARSLQNVVSHSVRLSYCLGQISPSKPDHCGPWAMQQSSQSWLISTMPALPGLLDSWFFPALNSAGILGSCSSCWAGFCVLAPTKHPYPLTA